MALILDQSLHGYADGHQLLATSVDLAKQQQSFMLVMSDLSGPAFRSGYESYLTGYPLAGSHRYCLARTWTAPEMPRPGCVWTHTILIRDEDVARVSDFRSLLRVFRRPTHIENFESYQSRVQWIEHDESKLHNPIETMNVLRAFYESSQRIVVPSDSSAKWEDTALSLMSQQWPRLRRSFRFCTGALSLRDLDFDLSVSPSEVTHSVAKDTLVLKSYPRAGGASDPWLELALNDLLQNDKKSNYREFLWLFGPDHSDGRTVFKPLSETFLLIQDLPSPQRGENILSALSHYFPKPEQARRLKAALFGEGGEFAKKLGGESSILRLLITHPSSIALDQSVSAIEMRAAKLVLADFEGATEIARLSAQLGGDNSKKFLDGYFGSEWSAEGIGRTSLDLLPLLLERHPDLIANPVLWARSDHLSLIPKLFGLLEKNIPFLEGAVTSLLTNGNWDAIANLLEQFGVSAFGPFFAALEKSDTAEIDVPDILLSKIGARPDQWRDLLRSETFGAKSLKLLSGELDPRSWYAGEIPVALLVKAAHLNLKFSERERELRSAIFFLSRGLGSYEELGAELVASSFSKVYRAAKANTIPPNSWGQIESRLAWYSPSWDRCARLIRTAARAFNERGWPLQKFCQTFQTTDEFSRAIDDINQSWSGHKFIRRLKKSVLNKDVKASAAQIAFLIKE